MNDTKIVFGIITPEEVEKAKENIARILEELEEMEKREQSEFYFDDFENWLRKENIHQEYYMLCLPETREKVRMRYLYEKEKKQWKSLDY